jgi:hypothetical protein
MTRPLATLEDSTLLKLALAGQAECRHLVAVKRRIGWMVGNATDADDGRGRASGYLNGQVSLGLTTRRGTRRSFSSTACAEQDIIFEGERCTISADEINLYNVFFERPPVVA